MAATRSFMNDRRPQQAGLTSHQRERLLAAPSNPGFTPPRVTRWNTRCRKVSSRMRIIPPSPVTRSFIASKDRSEEHTSELQSRLHLVCRLLLEKKKKKKIVKYWYNKQ